MFVFVFSIFISCEIEAEKIIYGKDQCSFCVMNIVDKTHSAQYVTKKGKQFKFDAIECMVNDLASKTEEDLAIILVANYNEVGQMIDANTASYIISKEIKSPMGAYLSAVATVDASSKLKQEHGGNIFTWETLKNHFSE